LHALCAIYRDIQNINSRRDAFLGRLENARGHFTCAAISRRHANGSGGDQGVDFILAQEIDEVFEKPGEKRLAEVFDNSGATRFICSHNICLLQATSVIRCEIVRSHSTRCMKGVDCTRLQMIESAHGIALGTNEIQLWR